MVFALTLSPHVIGGFEEYASYLRIIIFFLEWFGHRWMTLVQLRHGEFE